MDCRIVKIKRMRTPHMNNVKYLLIVVLLFLTGLAQGQTEFDDDVEDVPAAPIDGLIVPALIAAAYYGYKKTNKK